MASRRVSIWWSPFSVLLLVGIFGVPNPLTCQYAPAQENSIARDRPNTADKWVKVGDQELAAGKILQAIDAYREALRTEPAYESTYHRLAYLLGVIGRRNEQIDILYSGRGGVTYFL